MVREDTASESHVPCATDVLTISSRLVDGTHIDVADTLEVDRETLRQGLQPNYVIPIERRVVERGSLRDGSHSGSWLGAEPAPLKLLRRLSVIPDIRVHSQNQCAGAVSIGQDVPVYSISAGDGDSLDTTFDSLADLRLGLGPVALEVDLIDHAHLPSARLVHLVLFVEDIGERVGRDSGNALDDTSRGGLRVGMRSAGRSYLVCPISYIPHPASNIPPPASYIPPSTLVSCLQHSCPHRALFETGHHSRL
jgi:hypothetical protein